MPPICASANRGTWVTLEQPSSGFSSLMPTRAALRSGPFHESGPTRSDEQHHGCLGAASVRRAVCLLHEAFSSAAQRRMQTLPQFKVLERGEQPPNQGYHVLLVHRFSSDWRALVHDITGRVSPSAGKVCHRQGATHLQAHRGRPCGPLIRWRPNSVRRSCMYAMILDQ